MKTIGNGQYKHLENNPFLSDDYQHGLLFYVFLGQTIGQAGAQENKREESLPDSDFGRLSGRASGHVHVPSQDPAPQIQIGNAADPHCATGIAGLSAEIN